ncbi:hypothetical protein Gbem_3623 [Citrifermentans bemidjiense Bem]|uniref:Uncharacterized protein n=1 Tax=Citrifermentans bemidjiense (strain ATCC BAA-1014 / DSM 16622 / JCM 12645 / Bem) TaxID=404380 RepID=B5ECZ8_CITBB|nr:hypothetical protein [Citrifermentans bemidjiense]ACH40615.1 hypothetical protein Gbem_3623 [Citrifermentans bemidjiense Bem]
MRFLLVATIWLVLIGGLSLYSYERDRHKPPVAAAEKLTEAPAKAYTLELTPSFATAADPFALKGEASAKATLLVRVADREIYQSERPLPAGVAKSLTPVPGLVLGHNEIYVRAIPPQGETRDHALRVRLLQGGRVIADQTLWGEKGAVVAGSVPFDLTAAGEGSHEQR